LGGLAESRRAWGIRTGRRAARGHSRRVGSDGRPEQPPILELPPQFGQTARFTLEEISRYDRGPAWYWNNFRTGEHTGTHVDAPNHWATNQDGADIASVPIDRFLRPAVVLDFADRVADGPLLVEGDHIKQWEDQNGPVPDGAWMLFRTGWEQRPTQ
jgi:kynurenine formamidase